MSRPLALVTGVGPGTGSAIVRRLSAGGYGAVMLALHHLPAFSVVESWSGYFHPTDPAGENALDLGTERANANASAVIATPMVNRLRWRASYLRLDRTPDPTVRAHIAATRRDLLTDVSQQIPQRAPAA